MTRPYSMDLDGAPWGENCAQLGQTENFALVNEAEVALYRAALIAKAGPPPEGIELRIKTNEHDFGVYRTLEVVAKTSDLAEANSEYIDMLEEGLERWFHASFSPPDYSSLRTRDDLAGFLATAIRGAISSTRPLPSGEFFPPDFATLNANLRSAFPEHAEQPPA